MGKDLERLVLRIEANTAQLKSELRSVETRSRAAGDKMARSFDRAKRSMGDITRKVFSLRTAFVALAGVSALGLFIRRSLDVADAIGKTADAIGVTTGLLQEYRYALDLAGVSTDQTDKGLKKFVRNMGELGLTSSQTQTTLKDLDPTLLANLRALKSVDAQLDLSFEALSRYEDQAERAAVANALFGRAGIAFTVAVKAGVDPLRRLRAEARDLGIVIDDSLIRGAETAKDRLTTLSTVIDAKLTAAMIDLAPTIIKIAEAFIQVTQNAADFFSMQDPVAARSTGSLKRRIGDIRTEIESLKKEMDVGLGSYAMRLGLGMTLGIGIESKKSIREKLERLNTETLAITRELNNRKAKAATGAPPVSASGPTPFAGKELAMIEKALAEAKRGRTEALRFLNDIKKASLRATGQEVELIQMRQKEQLAALEKLRLNEAEVAEARVEINKTAEAEIADVVKRRTDQAANDLAKLKKTGEGAFKGMSNEVQAFGREASQQFARLLVTGEQTAFSLDGLFERLVSGALNDMIFSPITDFATGFLKSLRPGAAGAKGMAIGSGRVIPYASGGIVDRPTTFPMRGGTGLVGEGSKPEGILPLMRQANGDLGVQATGVGGGAVSIVINNNTGEAVDVRDQFNGRGGRDIEITFGEMMGRAIRGGREPFRAITDTFGIGPRTSGR